MKFIFMKKFNKIFIIINLLILALVQPLAVHAVTIIPRSNLAMENTASLQQDNFGLPDSIFITPIFLESEEFITDYDWYKGLYYYQTYRLNQGDFLFHYLAAGDGSIFQGNEKGEDQRFRIVDLPSNPIVIGYFARKNDIDFSIAARTKLAELLLDIANRNAVNPDNIFVRNIEYVAKANEAVSAKLTPIVGRWERSLKDIVNNFRGQYNPIGRQYALTVEKVELPASAVKYGDNVVVNITVKNASNYILYQGTDYEPLVAKTEGSLSKFYLNGVWLSQTQAPIMQEGSFLKPNESKSFQIRLGVPLYFGPQEETFQLINSLGSSYPETGFTLKLDVNRLDKQVVEITETETGQLNVRDNPWANSNIITRVSPGQRFIVLERTQTGYVKLDLGGGMVGWVVTKYTRVV